MLYKLEDAHCLYLNENARKGKVKVYKWPLKSARKQIQGHVYTHTQKSTKKIKYTHEHNQIQTGNGAFTQISFLIIALSHYLFTLFVKEIFPVSLRF